MTEEALKEALADLLAAGFVVHLPKPKPDGTTIITDKGKAALAMLAHVAGVEDKLQELIQAIHGTKPEGTLTH